MRRLALPLLLAVVAGGCVSVEPAADPHGALTGKRLVVIVNQSPGPWLVDAADSKAAALAKISPLGFLVNSVEDQHTLAVSKEIQQYLPRPRYGLAVRDALLKSLKTHLSSSTAMQTGIEAGISLEQLGDWNKSTDQLDWRQRYYLTDPDQPPPRDYAKILTLDDALILDVNVSFGTTADDADKLLPQMSAAERVYRGDTSHMIWSHEDELTDKTSTATLSEYELQPADLTDRIEKLAPGLGAAVGDSFAKAFGLIPSTSTHVTHSTATIAGATGGGLVPMSFFDHLSTEAPAGLAIPTAPAAVVRSSAAVSAVAVSSATAPVSISVSTAAAAAPPAATASTATAVASPPSVSTAAVSVPAPPPP